MSAINSKTGSTLTENSTNEEIVNVINNIEINNIKSGSGSIYLQSIWDGTNNFHIVSISINGKTVLSNWYVQAQYSDGNTFNFTI